MNRAFTSLAAAATIALCATAASAAVIDFSTTTSGSLTNQTSISGTINGIEYTARGFRGDDNMGSIGAAGVSLYTEGFGVDGVAGSITSPSSSDASDVTTASDRTIDGLGVDLNEFLEITFAQDVSITDLTFSFLDRLDDVYVRMNGFEGRYGFVDGTGIASGGAVLPNTGRLAGLPVLTGRVLIIGAGYPNQDCTTSASQRCGGGNDLFALRGADVSAVPLPAGGVLLLSGIAAVGAFKRRRKA